MLTHLRVASGFSMLYGASLPESLVEEAARLGFPALALTDKDSVAGAVRFAKACVAAGLVPLIGVDLGLPSGRVTVFPKSRSGWSTICRWVSTEHTKLELHGSAEVAMVLGLDSDVGLAIAAGQQLVAESRLRSWVADGFDVSIGVAHQGSAIQLSQSAKMLALADRLAVPAVLAGEVRMATKNLYPTLEVLDATRLGVPLGALKSRPGPGSYLSGAATLFKDAADISAAAGRSTPKLLLRETSQLAERLIISPDELLGLGEIVFPESELLRVNEPRQALRHRVTSAFDQEFFGNATALDRLEHELSIIEHLGFSSYFLTVAEVADLTRARGIRCAARGSGAGSLVNYLLGISGVNPMAHGLVFERFLSPARRKLPDIDLDVESDRRLEVYDLVFERFGSQRVACVAMIDTTRVRHAIRDVGAALSLSPSDVGHLAKTFPQVRAKAARSVLAKLPELQQVPKLATPKFWELVESLDSLPRHLAMHPCGLIISDATLAGRTPLLASAQGYQMTPFDKDDVEDLGMIKLDVLGVRMQSALTYAVAEIQRVEGAAIDIDSLAPFADEATYDLICRSETLGCFQIESPGQRELLGKFQPKDFNDIAIDISLFRPGPVQADMVHPFLEARHGWKPSQYFHDRLRPALAETNGVIIFHEQLIKVISEVAGVSFAEADEVRRELSDSTGVGKLGAWFLERALTNGFSRFDSERIWKAIASFGSFGFCKAHAVAFALPTYQSAWLKTHYSAAFLAGVLTHDPGMYPARLLLHEARRSGHTVLGVDVNASAASYRVEKTSNGYGIRVPFSRLKGISKAEVDSLESGQPYQGLVDLWDRTEIEQPTLENLILVGGFDSLYPEPIDPRDLLLAAAELRRNALGAGLPLSLSDEVQPSGLPKMTIEERLSAELDILGMDVSAHLLDPHQELLAGLGVVPASELLQQRSGAEILVAGVKVATQTPPVRSGRRVIFLTLDDGVGLVDLAFFDDTHAEFAHTIFDSWLLVARGVIRRTGPRGVSLRGTGAWSFKEAAVAPRKLWVSSQGSAGW